MEEERSLPKIVESNSDQHREIFSSNRNFSLAFQKKKKKRVSTVKNMAWVKWSFVWKLNTEFPPI